MGDVRPVLVVGERANVPSLGRDLMPARWLRLSLRLGAFRDPRSRKKLLSVGADLGDPRVLTVNLTPLSSQGVPWDRNFAESVAGLVDVSEYDITFLCGRKVTTAFGVAYEPGVPSFPYEQAGDLVVALPYPSGLCRFWNSASDVAGLRSKITNLLETTRCRR